MMGNRTCAVLAAHTGKYAKGAEKALKRLLWQTIEAGYHTFICGMDRGLEQLAAEVILSLRGRVDVQLCGLVDSEEQ